MAGPIRFEVVKNEDGTPVWDIAAKEEAVRTHRRSKSTKSSEELPATPKDPRCSKDLYAGNTIEYKSGTDTFVFPTPSPLLRSPSPRPLPALAPRSAAFQHLQSDLRRESPGIGIALDPTSPSWGRAQTPDGISARTQQRVPSVSPPAVPEKSVSAKPSKERPRPKKSSSWKLFSSIFMFRKSAKPFPVAKEASYRIELEVPSTPQLPPTCVEPGRLSPMPSPSATSPGASRRLHSRMPSDSLAQSRCESRSSVRTSFTRMLCSPCERFTPSPSPWRATFFRGERDPANSPVSSTPHPLAASSTPRLELDLPTPEMERYSVMFSQLLSPTSSHSSKPSLLERRLSRLPASPRVTNDLKRREDQSQSSPKSPRGENCSRSTHPLSVEVDQRRNTSAAPVPVVYRPQGIVRSRTAPVVESSFSLADSPGFHTASSSHSEASLPPTPTFLNADNDIMHNQRDLKDKTLAWNMLTTQPIIISSPDVSNPHSVDLERQMVQVSIARQVSISRARSRIRRTVSTKQPQMVDHVIAKNRKSEAGILDSVDFTMDPGEEDMPDAK